MYQIETLTSLEQMADIREEWNALWHNSSTRTPYQTWEWNYCWIKSMEQKNLLYILAARDRQGRLAGIGPLRRGLGLGKSGSLAFIGQEASTYTDFIIKVDTVRDVLEAFMGYIWNTPNIYIIDLKIAEPSRTVQIINELVMQERWYKVDSGVRTKRLIIELGEDYEAYLARLDRKMRQEIRAETRKLEKAFKVGFTVSSPGSDFEREIRILFELNALRWGGNADISHPGYRACYRAFRSTEAAKIFLLSCDDKPVAGLSAFVESTTLFAEAAGFDFSVAKIDLGKVFYNYVFRWAVSQGYKTVDFSSGEEAYKFRYKPDVFDKWQIRAFKDAGSYFTVTASDKIAAFIYWAKKRVLHNLILRSTPLRQLYGAIKHKRTQV
jgi:CelD/BcsL family acetyltransferase involved in cellulose biosynthesis